MATISLYDPGSVQAGMTGLVRLRLSRPMILLPGDRFVLRHGSPITTIGGGRVLDAHPIDRLTRVKTRSWLEDIRGADIDRQLAVRVARRGISGLSIADLSAETGLKAHAIRAHFASMVRDQHLKLIDGGLLLTQDAIHQAMSIATRELENIVKAGTENGVKKSELRSRTGLRIELFEHAVNLLESAHTIRSENEVLFASGDGDFGSARDHERLTAIALAFKTCGLTVPSPTSLATELKIDPSEMRRLVAILLREKTLVRLGDDSLCVHEAALAELKERIQRLRGRLIDVARFKELMGVSRKYAIPLLEYLDRERITKRQGDRRVVL